MKQQDKTNILNAILHLKCPRCRKGDLFENSTFSFKKSFDMPDRCHSCRQDFWPEPGFYYGAMFISYILSAFFSIGFVLFVHWVLGWSTSGSFFALILVSAVCFVYVFRLARSIWISINVKYQPGIMDQEKASASKRYG